MSAREDEIAKNLDGMLRDMFTDPPEPKTFSGLKPRYTATLLSGDVRANKQADWTTEVPKETGWYWVQAMYDGMLGEPMPVLVVPEFMSWHQAGTLFYPVKLEPPK